MSEWVSLGEELARQVMESPAFNAEEKAVFLASMERGRERQERLRRGEPVESIPIDWAHDGSEIHEDRLPGYRCHTCRDAGFVRRNVDIHHRDFGKAFPCSCRTEHPAFRAAKMKQLLATNGLPAPLQECTLASFVPVEGAVAAGRVAREFVDTMRNMQTPRWMAFIGPPGSGKTHLLAGITLGVCVEVGVQATYFDVRNFLMACKATGFAKDEEWTQFAIKVPVLVLDELLATGESDWDVKKLEHILMTRWERDLPTVVGMARTEDDFREWSAPLYSRFADVVRSQMVYLTAGDYRQRER